MMERRRWPRAAPPAGSTQAPSSSGPRWASVDVMRRTRISVSLAVRRSSRNPATPHIGRHLRRQGDDAHPATGPQRGRVRFGVAGRVFCHKRTATTTDGYAASTSARLARQGRASAGPSCVEHPGGGVPRSPGRPPRASATARTARAATTGHRREQLGLLAPAGGSVDLVADRTLGDDAPVREGPQRSRSIGSTRGARLLGELGDHKEERRRRLRAMSAPPAMQLAAARMKDGLSCMIASGLGSRR